MGYRLSVSLVAIFAVTLFQGVNSSLAQEADPGAEPLRTLASRALVLLAEQDSRAAIEFLVNQEDQRLVVEVCDALMRHCYWDQKDLGGSLLFGRTGVQQALSLATDLDVDNRAAADSLRTSARVLLYNIASFSWPGWAEPGIEISATLAEEGLAASRSNLKLARDLEKDPLPISRAWWMLGAHLLTAREYWQAADAFEQATTLAFAAGKRDEELLSRAFRQLALIQMLPEAGKEEQRLYQYLEELGNLPDGEFFTNQVETARQVLGGK